MKTLLSSIALASVISALPLASAEQWFHEVPQAPVYCQTDSLGNFLKYFVTVAASGSIVPVTDIFAHPGQKNLCKTVNANPIP